MNLGPVVPILRMFDAAKAREFYVGFLGFALDWEHRFEPSLPLYMQVSCGDCRLHLSEHHGDCAPGAAVRIGCGNLDAFRTGLVSRLRDRAGPGGIESPPWGGRELTVLDPFQNRLVFVERQGQT